MRLLALSAHTGTRLAELAFLLILIGGCALALTKVRPIESQRVVVTFLAGSAFALAGLLLIIATHWGHFT
jgi:hypothetical protein